MAKDIKPLCSENICTKNKVFWHSQIISMEDY